MVRTPLCDALGIDAPIFNVGFGVSATPELAAAVRTRAAAASSG